jgi:hypothetical protein
MSSNARRRDDLAEYWFEKIAMESKVLNIKVNLHSNFAKLPEKNLF